MEAKWLKWSLMKLIVWPTFKMFPYWLFTIYSVHYISCKRSNKTYTTGATGGAGITYPSGEPEFTPGFFVLLKMFQCNKNRFFTMWNNNVTFIVWRHNTNIVTIKNIIHKFLKKRLHEQMCKNCVTNIMTTIAFKIYNNKH